MDASSLAQRYKCGVCGYLPEEPYGAEDGHVYHEACIKAIFHSASESVVTSPVTHLPMGRRVVFATTIKCLIDNILESGAFDDSLIRPNFLDASSVVRETKELAQKGYPEHMAKLGRWYLLGEQEGIDCDEETRKEGYVWCKKAAEKGDPKGMAYQGVCLILGYGVAAGRIDGFELLVDAANEGSAWAAYKLGSYYLHGVHGFKEDRKRAERWLCKADDARDKLTESEKENVGRYLKSILGGPRQQALAMEAVPENIDVASVASSRRSRGNTSENDHDSMSALTSTAGSAGTGASSLSSSQSPHRGAASAAGSSSSHHNLDTKSERERVTSC